MYTQKVVVKFDEEVFCHSGPTQVKKIQMIKHWRTVTGLGLREAKLACEKLIDCQKRGVECVFELGDAALGRMGANGFSFEWANRERLNLNTVGGLVSVEDNRTREVTLEQQYERLNGTDKRYVDHIELFFNKLSEEGKSFIHSKYSLTAAGNDGR